MGRSTGVDLTVLIPTGGRPHKLGACLQSLARQSLPTSRYEVIVGIDGPENGELEFVGSCPAKITLLSFAKSGMAAARARVLEAANGTYALMLADSAVCDKDLLARHLAAQVQAAGGAGAKRGTLITGAVTFDAGKPERLVDRFVANTRVMSGYLLDTDETIDAALPQGNFRAIWTANLSFPVELASRLGSFCRQLSQGRYDGLEFAWRLQKWLQTPVTTLDEAKVALAERCDPKDCFHRIVQLGYEAITLEHMNPACAMDVFGREIGGIGASRQARTLISRERCLAEQAMVAFLSLGHSPLAVLKPGEEQARLKKMTEMFELCRPWLWHTGQLAALDNQPLAGTIEDLDARLHEVLKASGSRAA
jgi:hypothetical protein